MKKDLSITIMIALLVQGSYSHTDESKVPCPSDGGVVPSHPDENKELEMKAEYDTDDSEEMPDEIDCPEDEEHDIGLSKDDHHKPDSTSAQDNNTLDSFAFGLSIYSNFMIGLVAMALF
jgi:hypothetical protein